MSFPGGWSRGQGMNDDMSEVSLKSRDKEFVTHPRCLSRVTLCSAKAKISM